MLDAGGGLALAACGSSLRLRLGASRWLCCPRRRSFSRLPVSSHGPSSVRPGGLRPRVVGAHAAAYDSRDGDIPPAVWRLRTRVSVRAALDGQIVHRGEVLSCLQTGLFFCYIQKTCDLTFLTWLVLIPKYFLKLSTSPASYQLLQFPLRTQTSILLSQKGLPI